MPDFFICPYCKKTIEIHTREYLDCVSCGFESILVSEEVFLYLAKNIPDGIGLKIVRPPHYYDRRPKNRLIFWNLNDYLKNHKQLFWEMNKGESNADIQIDAD